MADDSFPARPTIASSQLGQLRRLLAALIPANPFYTKKFSQAGVTARVPSLEEFSQTFPFTTKQEIAEDQRAQPPYGTNLTYPFERYTRSHQTSGTGGAPLRWLDTPESWNWMLGSWEEILRAAGVSVTPARSALTATPAAPSSSASCRTWDSRAALAADTAP